MKPLRTLSPSVMEAQLRQNVKRTSSKKRKVLQLSMSDADKENRSDKLVQKSSNDFIIERRLSKNKRTLHNILLKSKSLGFNERYPSHFDLDEPLRTYFENSKSGCIADVIPEEVNFEPSAFPSQVTCLTTKMPQIQNPRIQIDNSEINLKTFNQFCSTINKCTNQNNKPNVLRKYSEHCIGLSIDLIRHLEKETIQSEYSPSHRKLSRLVNNVNTTYKDFNHQDHIKFIYSDDSCKRRRLSLPSSISTPNNEVSSTKIFGNISELSNQGLELQSLCQLKNVSDEVQINCLDENNLENTESYLNFQNEVEPKNSCNGIIDHFDTEDANSVWSKYLKHKTLEKTESEGYYSMSSEDNDSLCEEDLTDPTSIIPSGDDDSTPSTPKTQRSLRIRHFQTRVRDSFKGLQRISSFNIKKSGVSRTRSEGLKHKSSFKSYIFHDPVCQSISTPSLPTNSPEVEKKPLRLTKSVYSNVRPSLHDIFVTYPEIADNFVGIIVL